ncbi:oligopeptide transport system ATP-binding protein [Devosia enhydra]|uniref:Oligopeptide transport system ATP-binding protein n=1 Tax=Devosia enhydra TaxID=665118 RepID=A0A1K2I2B6_9HYPH|nr:ABC transporter ATP-binding protein [Devosia enhydra]SFZ86363.1 oligopeptide transport system ATP-binding protein [Devosia enhydra]
MTTPLLEVDGLVTEFRTRGGVLRAVDKVSFSVLPGETLALVGESGCGKSATALSLMRLIGPPNGHIEGSVRFDGTDVLTLSPREVRDMRGRNIAMIFQDPMTSLNPVLTIGLQLTETLKTHLGLTGQAARDRARDLLAMVGIPEPAKRLKDFPHQFSGGMRQRVMIAMALSCNPRLILADEITTALDVTIQAQVLELLKRLSRETGTAMVLITHDLGVVAGMADRVNVMYAGQIVESTRTGELFRNPRMPYTWGLLDSVPRMDASYRERLVPIRGLPPNLLDPPKGCRFAPRCAYRRDICGQKAPDLIEVPQTGESHLARCWGTQDVAGGGWLIGHDRKSAAAALSAAAQPELVS